MRDWEEVLDFWFSDSPGDTPEQHGARWAWRMRGQADAEIVARFADLTQAGAAGDLDHWAADPFGRLALIVVVDQFPRSLWRDDPQSFAQDLKALALALEGYDNGHYVALTTPWHRTVYNLPLGHCEGPGHLERLDLAQSLADEIVTLAPEHLRSTYAFAASQPAAVRAVITRFGRHPHRNAVLGRPSTPEEAAYIATGAFPHLRQPGSPAPDMPHAGPASPGADHPPA